MLTFRTLSANLCDKPDHGAGMFINILLDSLLEYVQFPVANENEQGCLLQTVVTACC
jgi:hypothetical protein